MSPSARWATTSSSSTAALVLAHGLAVNEEHARRLVEAVHHHVRTPLTALLGHHELLMQHDHSLPPEVERSLACVERAARRLNDVVTGICDLIDAACVDTTSVAPVDVTELIADEITTVRHLAAQRDVDIVVAGEGSGRWVADPGRLGRAVRELLANAVTYAPIGSTARIEMTATDTALRIEVSDNGDGIDPADRLRMVQPFERGNHPSQPHTGRGMGLALATAVAASHGGRLTLSENHGGGLRAAIDLPMRATVLPTAAVAF